MIVATFASFAAEPAPAPAPSKVAEELAALVARTKARLEGGARTEAALAEELKAFDALLAAHRAEKTDDVAEVLFTKAALYLQVLGDFDRGAAALQQLKRDFPGTQPARAADEVLAQIDQQKESQRLQAALQPGAVFPDFAEKDLSGAPLSVSRFKGKVLLVDFWATWCGPCVGELPNVVAAYRKYHPMGFEIVGISLDQNEATLEKFIKANGVVWAQYFDGQGWDSKLGKKYGVTSIPATFLLDREGRIVARDLRGPELEAQLARLLEK